MKRMTPEVLAAVGWVQRDSTFLKVLDGLAILFAVLYGMVWLSEKRGLARRRRLRSAAVSGIGLGCFAAFLAVRVFVIRQ
jgi:dolichyl-phosphate-mannose--protein O-mannosyl transferase